MIRNMKSRRKFVLTATLSGRIIAQTVVIVILAVTTAKGQYSINVSLNLIFVSCTEL